MPEQDRLSAIEGHLQSMDMRLSRIEGSLNGRSALCQYEQERIGRLEAAMGKQNFVAALVAAVTAGLSYTIYWIATR